MKERAQVEEDDFNWSKEFSVLLKDVLRKMREETEFFAKLFSKIIFFLSSSSLILFPPPRIHTLRQMIFHLGLLFSQFTAGSLNKFCLRVLMPVSRELPFSPVSRHNFPLHVQKTSKPEGFPDLFFASLITGGRKGRNQHAVTRNKDKQRP